MKSKEQFVNIVSKRTSLALAAVFLSQVTAQAAVIFTENFESYGVADGTFTSNFGTMFTQNFGAANLLNPATTGGSAAWLNPVPAALGTTFGVLHSQAITTATLGTNYAPNTTYDFTFTGFKRDDLSGVTFAAQFLNGVTQLAGSGYPAETSNDTFVTRTLSYTTGAAGPEIGQAISLRFFTDQGQTSNLFQAGFDNISLTATAIPEPSAALLSCFGAIALLRRRR